MVCVLRGGIPMKSQPWKGAYLDARGEIPPEESGGRFKPRENVRRSGGTFHRGDKYIRISEFPVDLYIGHKDLFQARVIDLVDQHLREYLFDAVGNAL